MKRCMWNGSILIKEGAVVRVHVAFDRKHGVMGVYLCIFELTGPLSFGLAVGLIIFYSRIKIHLLNIFF